MLHWGVYAFQVMGGGEKEGQVRAQDSDITFTTDLFTVDYPCLDNLRVYKEVIPCSQPPVAETTPCVALLVNGAWHSTCFAFLRFSIPQYCECPEEDPPGLAENSILSDKEPQIEKDFASFPSINLQQMLIEVPKRFGDERVLLFITRFSITTSTEDLLGKYTDFKMFSDEILLSLTKKGMRMNSLIPKPKQFKYLFETFNSQNNNGKE